jgi:hypothetical protein
MAIFQNKSFEQYAPKGEFLESGIDISMVATDDLIFGKIVTRLLLWDTMKNRAYLLNSNPKYLYDSVAGISLWLKQYEDNEFAEHLEKINNRITEEITSFRLEEEKNRKQGLQQVKIDLNYLRYSDEILIEIFNLMARLSWTPISKTKIATLLQDKVFKQEIEEAIGTIEKADMEEQKQMMQDFVVQDLIKEEKKVEDNANS